MASLLEEFADHQIFYLFCLCVCKLTRVCVGVWLGSVVSLFCLFLLGWLELSVVLLPPSFRLAALAHLFPLKESSDLPET